MNERQALQIALYRMEVAEGTEAVNQLVRECACLAATDSERELAQPLTEIPLIGEMMALEVLAKIGWKCATGKETR